MEDEQILELYRQRDEAAIRETERKYGKYLAKIAYSILANAEDSRESVSDAYLGAWNAIPPARPKPLQAYLCKIVRNLSLKRCYHKEAEKRSSAYEIAMRELEDYLPAADTVEAEMEARELSELIEGFLETLTVENRVIFMRRYAYMDAYADIAARVGLSENNVAVRLNRIRRKLKRYLLKREVFI